MESLTILPASEGLGFTYTNHKVAASIHPTVKIQWSTIFESPVFQKWAIRFLHDNAYQLLKIRIEHCTEDCQCIEMVVDAKSSEGDETIQQKLILSPPEISILIVFPYKAFSKETCLLIRDPCMINGMQEHFVLPKGFFMPTASSDGQKNYVFSSPHSAILKSCLGLTIEKDKLISLSERAAKQVYGTDINATGLSCQFSQKCNVNPETVRQYGSEFYLYYCNIDVSLAERLQAALAKAKEEQGNMSQYKQLQLVPLKDLWKSTTDTAAMTSAYLYSRLKIAHQISLKELSKCRGPDADSIPDILRSSEALKRVPQFCKVSSLCPTSKNINIRVKVVEPITKKDKAKNSWEMLVGDDGAIVCLRLTEQQLNIPDVVNTPLFIRNAHVSMDNGHMHLVVGHWGKISVASSEEMDQFNFSVGTVKNMSEVEYELVIIEDSHGVSNTSADKTVHPDERDMRFNRNRRPRSKQAGRKEEKDGDAETLDIYRTPDDRVAAMNKREPRQGNMLPRRRNRFRGRGGRIRQERQAVLVN